MWLYLHALCGLRQATPLCTTEVSAPMPLARCSLPWPCYFRLPSATLSPFPSQHTHHSLKGLLITLFPSVWSGFPTGLPVSGSAFPQQPGRGGSQQKLMAPAECCTCALLLDPAPTVPGTTTASFPTRTAPPDPKLPGWGLGYPRPLLLPSLPRYLSPTADPSYLQLPPAQDVSWAAPTPGSLPHCLCPLEGVSCGLLSD